MPSAGACCRRLASRASQRRRSANTPTRRAGGQLRKGAFGRKPLLGRECACGGERLHLPADTCVDFMQVRANYAKDTAMRVIQPSRAACNETNYVTR